jgi:hypothetical protein
VRKIFPIIVAVVAVLVLLVIGIVNCPFQFGRFTTDASRSVAILPQPGLIEIVEGTPSGSDALHQDLLYLLVVCPNVQTHGSGSGMKMDTFVTTLNYTWDANPDSISIQVKWNRETGKITIGVQKFSRENGNVFVVEGETSGKISGYQLPSLGSHAGFPEVLRHIQQEMPNDNIIDALKLYPN